MKKKYSSITPDLNKRLEYELSIIKNMGYAGYFLITQDFVKYAKDSHIPVGPGRGSAAGSIVAYCTGITDVDPIKYNLLFERFLNPERISMPDIDIDFCIEGREKVINYIKDSYGTSIKTFKRDSSLARLNIGIEHTILELLKNLFIKNIKPDYILLLYIEYPFKEGWQIDEALHTAELFEVEVVDGIILNNEIFYKHDGSGLKPLIKDSFLHLEREQLYRRVGSINLIKTEYLINGGKIMDGKIGHINLDQKSAFQIKSNLDWQIANFLAGKKINE